MENSKFRILAIAPSTRGIGFAVLENSLVDYGVKNLKKGDKNVQSLAAIEEIVALYQPALLVLEDYSAKGSRRHPRIRKLGSQILAWAETRKLQVKQLSQLQVRQGFFDDRKGTKQEIAEILAEQFPEDLARLLPPAREAWDSEHYRMGKFDALALAVAAKQPVPGYSLEEMNSWR